MKWEIDSMHLRPMLSLWRNPKLPYHHLALDSLSFFDPELEETVEDQLLENIRGTADERGD